MFLSKIKRKFPGNKFFCEVIILLEASDSCKAIVGFLSIYFYL